MNYGYVYPHPKQAWWYNPQALSARESLGYECFSMTLLLRLVFSKPSA